MAHDYKILFHLTNLSNVTVNITVAIKTWGLKYLNVAKNEELLMLEIYIYVSSEYSHTSASNNIL